MLAAGALSGDKDLLKIGGLISGAGAISNTLSTTAAAGGEASAAWGAEGSAAGSDAAQFGKYGWQDPSLTSATAGPNVGTIGADAVAAAGTTTDPATSILGYAQRLGGKGAPTQATQAMSATAAPAPSVTSQYVDPVQAAGSKMDSTTMNSILQSAWDKTKALGTGLGVFVRNNKELVQLGGDALKAALGPDAERVDFERQQLERRLRNLNDPVQVGATGGWRQLAGIPTLRTLRGLSTLQPLPGLTGLPARRRRT